MRFYRKICKSESGFTLIEITIITVLMIISGILFLQGCSTAGLKESYLNQVRENLAIIRAAVERYAVDHDGNYPQFLLGGDIQGWDTENGCDAISDRPMYAPNIRQTNLEGGGAEPPRDPLIQGGYLRSYPDNPLLASFRQNAPTLSGGVAKKLGTGDVRFGYDAMKMGNVLDDPRFLWSRYPVFGQPEKIRVQPTRLINTMSRKAYDRNFNSIHPKNEINPFYSCGGIPNSRKPGTVLNRWWPGEFFYRATGDLILRKDINPEDYEKAETLTIWEFEVEKYTRYILGAYGDTKSPGLDLIRLTAIDEKTIQNRSGIIQDRYRRSPYALYPEDKTVYMSPPEIFGGGGKSQPPLFPYLDENGEFIYGAPDGFPDGILEPVYIDHNRTLSEL
jgi:competence protein ComGC